MRPPGVRQRVTELLDSEWAHVHSRPEHLLRVHVTSFLNLCARLWYSDHPTTTVLKRYQEVRSCWDDKSQVRTYSDFEDKSLACIEQLHPEIGWVTERPVEDITFDEQESVRGTLLRVPPTVLLGEAGPHSYFQLVCWNEANSLIEGFETPYRAARQIANMGFHHPADPFGLIDPLADLAMRYEDYPEERGRVAEEITAVLSAYVTRAPWGRI
ncbi:MAG TPA: hypothetical protein VHH34_16405 [Pseudonocardiaceae bacterium]|nr:hypothetical protein [Pseudonocardiaceae bacterium]